MPDLDQPKSSLPPVPIPHASPDAPYKGLLSFGEGDVALLAGRELDIRRCAGVLASPHAKTLLLHGKTGCGKSSFLRAGLIPTLEQRGFGFEFLKSPSVTEWTHIFIRCTDAPLDRLAERVYLLATAGYLRESPFGQDTIDLSEATKGLSSKEFREQSRKPGMLADAVRILGEKLPVTLVLVLDQAEEVLTLRPGEQGEVNRRAFFEFLRDFNGGRIDAKLIIALRTEFYGRFFNAMSLDFGAGAADSKQYELGDLSKDDIVRAIERPTETTEVPGYGVPFDKYGFSYAKGVPERIATDLVKSREAGVSGGLLPLMQVTCKALYEDVLTTRQPRTVTLEHYEALGGIHGSIDRHIDASIERVIDTVKRGASPTIARTLQGLRGDEARMWHFVLAGLYSVADDGTVTTKLRSLEEIEGMAREIGTQLNVSAMLDALAVPEVGLLRRAKVLEPTGEVEKFSLGHDALGLSLQRWQTEDEGRLKAYRKRRVKRWANSFVLAGLVIALALASYYGNDPLEFVSVGGTVAPEFVDFEDGQLPPTYRGNWMLENADGADAEALGTWSLATPSIGDNQVAFFELTPATGGFLDLSFDFFQRYRGLLRLPDCPGRQVRAR